MPFLPARRALIVAAAPDNHIKFTKEDANAFRSVAENPALVGCDPKRTIFIENCKTGDELERRFKIALRDLRDNEQLIFYYSGHGRVGKGFQFELGRSPLEITSFATLISYCDTEQKRRVIFVIDACRSGSAAYEKGTSQLVPGNFGDIPADISVLASCQSHQSSYEDPTQKISYFTGSLCKHINAGSDRHPDNPCIDAITLIENVNKELSQNLALREPMEAVYRIPPGSERVWFSLNPAHRPHLAEDKLKKRDLSLVGFESPKKKKNGVVARSNPHVREYQQSSLLLVADVPRLALREANDQVNLLRKFWTAIEKVVPAQAANRVDRIIDGTFDGLSIAFRNLTDVVSCDRILSLALELSKRLHDEGIEIRVGLHSGPVYVAEAAKSGTKVVGQIAGPHLLGRGVTDAFQMLSFAPPATVLASEEFLHRLDGERPQNEDWKQDFFPVSTDPAFDISDFGDRRRRLTFRFYVGEQRFQTASNSFLLDLRRVVSFRIIEKLKQVHDEFIDHVTQRADHGATAEEIDCRVSLFAKSILHENIPRLHAGFRYHPENHGVEPGAAYPVGGSGVGPAGVAYASRSIQIIHRLKEFGEDRPMAYAGPLIERFYGDLDFYRAFKRKARTFISLPCGLVARAEPDLVICIDAMSDLSWISRSQLLGISRLLHTAYDEIISALWNVLVSGDVVKD